MKIQAALILALLGLSSACSKDEAPSPQPRPAPPAAPAPAQVAPETAPAATGAEAGGQAAPDVPAASDGSIPGLPPGAMDTNTPLVKVNDKTIYRHEVLSIVDSYCQRMEGGCPDEEAQKKVVQFVVDQMIAMALVDQESAKANLPVSDEDINTRLNEVTAQIGGPEQLKAMLAQAGKTLEEFQAEIRSDVRRRKFVKTIQDKATAEGKDPQQALEETMMEIQKSAKIEKFD